MNRKVGIGRSQPPTITAPHAVEPEQTALPSPVVGRARPSGSRPGRFLWGLGALFAVLMLARLIPHLPLPVCGLRALTGIPCPLCGTTRCLRAWSHLDLVQAFQLNPMVAAAVAGIAAWLLFRAMDSFFGRDWAGLIRLRAGDRLKPGQPTPERQRDAESRYVVPRFGGRTYWPAILIVAALANWVYLICCLPK